MSLPKYIEKCLDIVIENEHSHALIKGLKNFYENRDAFVHGKDASRIGMYWLNTIGVYIFCNFCHHADQTTIKEMIDYVLPAVRTDSDNPPTKTWEWHNALDKIKANPEEILNDYGGNRGVSWYPIIYKKANL